VFLLDASLKKALGFAIWLGRSGSHISAQKKSRPKPAFFDSSEHYML